MAETKLHLDADASSKSLQRALLRKGHDVTRTPTEWVALDASDETQLLAATAQGRAIFTFNIRDFLPLAAKFPNHAGIVLAAQSRWTLSELIEGLDRCLRELEADELVGTVRWLER